MALSKKRLEEALEHYDFAIKLDPMYEKTYYARGIAKYKLNKPKEAIKDFDEAIKLYSYYAKAYFYRGIVKKSLNLIEEAEKDFDKALRLDPAVKKKVKRDDI